MYATCIFCAASLGRNEALEHFPVGRRLAFDAAKGRLWVVCPRCERWNLTPLDTRWEAIEEAERQYRSMRLRVSTDNIGLTRLPEGTELVRIGAPLLPEFAAWRYGDQFGRRRRKHIALTSVGVAAAATMPFVPLMVGAATLAGSLSLAQLTAQAFQFVRLRRQHTRVRTTVRDESGQRMRLTAANIRSAALLLAPASGNGIILALPHGRQLPADAMWKALSRRGTVAAFEGYTEITGDAALRVLGTILPQLNAHGGKQRVVRDAVSVINGASDTRQLLHESMARAADGVRDIGIKPGQSYMHALAPRDRLALEMALHQDDERRAMEGELRELEQRWRDAEEIAAIADSLTVPPEIDERLATLRSKTDA